MSKILLLNMITTKKKNILEMHDCLPSSWHKILGNELKKPYMKKLWSFLKNEQIKGKIIYPEISSWFEAFNKTSFQDVKVIILGQDPYHGEGQAHGLCFSVKFGANIPPSLRNIYKELQDDIGIPEPTHGNLESWSKQGVLLLNTALTVEQSIPGSHQMIGWEIFTNSVIKELSSQRKNLVFMLWGKNAQNKSTLINANLHCILKAPHPSPLSSYKGFMGCKHFSLANKYIFEHGQRTIDWLISS
jgi:uracil-DNA glycosylase